MGYNPRVNKKPEMRSARCVALAALVFLSGCGKDPASPPTVPGAPVASFRFTVTSDNHAQSDVFREVLSQVRSRAGGPGAFHATIGDIVDGAGTLATLRSVFGADVPWYVVLGNHDVADPAQVAWFHSYNAVIPGLVRSGPVGTERTAYSFDVEYAHFVVLNEYFDGTSETGTDGDVEDVQYAWLADDLERNTLPIVVVFGHEPAYPVLFHSGDSLDQYPAHRDRFWDLLESRRVAAFISGHTHERAALRRTSGGTWQINVGTAGQDLLVQGYTFLNATVTERSVRFELWSGPSGAMTLDRSFTTSPAE